MPFITPHFLPCIPFTFFTVPILYLSLAHNINIISIPFTLPITLSIHINILQRILPPTPTPLLIATNPLHQKCQLYRTTPLYLLQQVCWAPFSWAQYFEKSIFVQPFHVTSPYYDIRLAIDNDNKNYFGEFLIFHHFNNSPIEEAVHTITFPIPFITFKIDPTGKLRNENYEAGQKFCKFAISAMQFEDPATAIKNLKLALHEMGTNV